MAASAITASSGRKTSGKKRRTGNSDRGAGSIRTVGLIDLQFNGAFGVDLLCADARELQSMARKLLRKGTAGFLPTLISSDCDVLESRVAIIGEWVRNPRPDGSIPLGIHLEGPFINPGAAGVHPKKVFRKATLNELDRLWLKSSQTLKLITFAPEMHDRAELKSIIRWSNDRGVRLSIGHSLIDYDQAREAFALGVHAVTHAWNASRFHHRDPGVLGAALGNPDVYVQFIPDRLHVHPVVLDWTRELHPKDRLITVSDAAPSADATPGSVTSFGLSQVTVRQGKATLAGTDDIAGGGENLARLMGDWVSIGARSSATSAVLTRLKAHLDYATLNPRRFLGAMSRATDKRLSTPILDWRVSGRGQIRSQIALESLDF